MSKIILAIPENNVIGYVLFGLQKLNYFIRIVLNKCSLKYTLILANKDTEMLVAATTDHSKIQYSFKF